MKKIIALILAAVMTAALAILPASAAPGNENYGSVKKISDSDVNMSNGDRDAIWDYGLQIDMSNGDPDSASGKAWVLWSDKAFYIYVEVNDNTPVSLDMSDWSDGDYFEAWKSDSVEVFIEVDGEQGDFDARTPGNFGDHCWQFRIDRDGIPSSYQRSGGWTDDFMCGGSVNKDRYEWAAKKIDANNYAVKFKITMLGAPKPGEVGFQLQINDLVDEDTEGPQIRLGDIGGSWNADEYGYVVLVDEPAYVAPAVPDDPGPADEGEPEVITPPPAVQPPAAQTGDAGIIILAAAMIIAAAGVAVFGKKHSAK